MERRFPMFDRKSQNRQKSALIEYTDSRTEVKYLNLEHVTPVFICFNNSLDSIAA